MFSSLHVMRHYNRKLRRKQRMAGLEKQLSSRNVNNIMSWSESLMKWVANTFLVGENINWISEHSGSYEKCQKSQAKGLTIDVHKWPLPKRDFWAKAVVFELNVPTVVSKWRDTTYLVKTQDSLASLWSTYTKTDSSERKRLVAMQTTSSLLSSMLSVKGFRQRAFNAPLYVNSQHHLLVTLP